MAAELVPNKKVILKNYITGFVKETDMELITSDTIQLKLPEGSPGLIVKNLYLSCDPYMRSRMSKHDEPSYVPDFVAGSVFDAIFHFSILLFKSSFLFVFSTSLLLDPCVCVCIYIDR
ncbi:2-alkenal reductase (NADP(+)) protein [Dioscorea alata]|uniref:2-alkenal reductase (NADP(+)) protein n=1 Tax=Dioscorea alata TaxID=55571 RepID=A0ACB7VBD6_DIOAL|nr:2-alkenal reductase (NADP(+)) protein [Dioscorea alata]